MELLVRVRYVRTQHPEFQHQDRCLLVLEGYGVGPNMQRLICHFWDEAQMVCHASGNYGMPFKAGHGVTQGGPLSSKLFNLVVVAVACEWLVWLPLEGARDHGNNTWKN